MLARLSVVTVALALLAAGASAAGWSGEATLSGCVPAASPQVVFPASSPSAPSGRGAIMWVGCGALEAATLHSDDRPSIVRRLVVGEGLRAPLAAAGTTAGQLVAAARSSGGALLAEGLAGGRLRLARALGSPVGPIAGADGWIGDADVAYATRRGGREAIELFEQRHYARSFGGPVTLEEGSAPITSLYVAMDFRADSIVLWTAGGMLHGQFVSNDGVAGPAQVVGRAGAITEVSAVLSDNGHAFVTWSAEAAAGVPGQATVYLVHSGPSVRFGGVRPRVIASFSEPAGLRLGPGSLGLVRMAPSEGVLAAWTLLEDGHYVVQAAGLTSSHILPPYTVGEPGGDLRLAAIAAGPHDDAAIVLARAPRAASGWETSQQSLLAARSIPGGPGGVAFETPVQIAAPGPNSDPSIAFDPHTDGAVVAWQAAAGRIAYAVRTGR